MALTRLFMSQAGMMIYATISARLSLGKLQANTGRSLLRTLLLLATGFCGAFIVTMIVLLIVLATVLIRLI